MGTSRREPLLSSQHHRATCNCHERGKLAQQKVQAAAVLTETKHEVGIADQPRRSVGRDAKLLRKYADVHRWPQEGRISQERIQGARNQYQRLLGVAPLQRVVGVLCWDREKCLAIAGVVALCRPEIDRSRDVFLVGMAGSLVSLVSDRRHRLVTDLCARCFPGWLLLMFDSLYRREMVDRRKRAER